MKLLNTTVKDKTEKTTFCRQTIVTWAADFLMTIFNPEDNGTCLQNAEEK